MFRSNISLEMHDKSTLLNIYEKNNVDPEKMAIVMMLDGMQCVPLSRYYDNSPLNEALKDIAEILRDQIPQKIYIGNILDDHYKKNSIHHFELIPRERANKLESSLALSASKDELLLKKFLVAEICKDNYIPLDILQIIMSKYALLRRCTDNIVQSMFRISFFKKPGKLELSDLLARSFEQLPPAFQNGLKQYYKTMDANLNDAKHGWNDNLAETRVQLLYRVTNIGDYPVLTSNEAENFYNLKIPAWESASIENRKKILKEFAKNLIVGNHSQNNNNCNIS